MKIFVANMPFKFKGSEIRQLFEVFGKVLYVRIMVQPDTGKSKGFGFLEMPDEGMALRAIHSLHQLLIEDRTLIVQEAEKQEGSGVKGRRPRIKTDVL